MNYDLILLDYEMEGMTGFETARKIREKSENISLAFVTVFYEFSRAGYRFDAIRYLVKQEIDFENELRDCLDKAIRKKNMRKSHREVFNFIGKTVAVDVEKIIYITSRRHYLQFYISENDTVAEYELRDNLSNIEDKLSDTHLFSIVRRGQLVNLKYVISIDGKGFARVSIGNNQTRLFQLSDSRRSSFISDYMRYIGDERI